MRTELADTLLQLFQGLAAPEESGLVVTSLDVEMPVEVTAAVRGRELVFLAQAPHSRWQAGFLPPVQRLGAKLVLEE
ncbi:hypothetical protein H8N03_16200 [Ramlibacter sp. USB13]|uniref:Uncharacterized protein n=1 Tax=Ramlibacter cellulosilyticus TaxID=2764187 RepID=A0A923MT25_9BURK|nr:hypothetical protein [Ramlibacter cellulosilyticus]MBC5784491.1 hypothetical protein [Ramlibacter cellulosilyticus]